MEKKDIICVIPARSGSKGVPNKNILSIAGFPLLAFSIAAAKNCKFISRIIVSTDSQEYAEIATDLGAEVPFIRPKDISGDQSTDLEFFKHLISFIESNESFVPDYLVHLRPTTPLRDPSILDLALNEFVGSTFSALRSCHSMSESAYKSFEVEDGKLKRIFSQDPDVEGSNFSRQTFPITYEANGYVDIVRSENIVQNGKLHGSNVKAFLTERAYEIDQESDLEYIKYLVQKEPKYLKLLGIQIL